MIEIVVTLLTQNPDARALQRRSVDLLSPPFPGQWHLELVLGSTCVLASGTRNASRSGRPCVRSLSMDSTYRHFRLRRWAPWLAWGCQAPASAEGIGTGSRSKLSTPAERSRLLHPARTAGAISFVRPPGAVTLIGRLCPRVRTFSSAVVHLALPVS